ncbi:MAG TPA: TlpA disulfide reductase family protein [Sphingomicrobium sp.]|nr:TlpA disulfide reductase family protein [Sphingomicrobium sp.]
MSRRFALLGSVLLLPLFGCDREPAAPQGQDEVLEETVKGAERSHAGKPMPEVQLFDADNQAAALPKSAGEPVLVNFWASWCAPCVKELPTLDALSRRPGAPRVIIVSLDTGPRPSVDAFLKTHGIEHLESWHDPKMGIASALNVQVMPTTVYYDRQGREIWRYLGDLDWTGEEAGKLLAEAKAKAAR